MEPLWSPVVATGGNRSQIRSTRKPQKQAKSVATGCHRLPEKFHGKKGVDGSSPSESPAKARKTTRRVWLPKRPTGRRNTSAMQRKVVPADSPYAPTVGYSRAVRVGDHIRSSFIDGASPLAANQASRRSNKSLAATFRSPANCLVSSRSKKPGRIPLLRGRTWRGVRAADFLRCDPLTPSRSSRASPPMRPSAPRASRSRHSVDPLHHG